MSADLFAENGPDRFWRPLIQVSASDWDSAVRRAAAELPPACRPADGRAATLLALTLGEGQFGPRHWRLDPAKRLYYVVKPILPRAVTRHARRFYGTRRRPADQLGWPVEEAYVRFQRAVVSHLLDTIGADTLPFIDFWPEGRPYAFVLTHDIETAEGQAQVLAVADLDAGYGFRSSFNFVPERYRVDRGLVVELKARGFEVGVHGLKHDGRDFATEAEFRKRVGRINHHLRELGAAGFRAPLTLRHPEWMQALEVEYDSSFFDTDPYEPIAGGTMSIWPFQLGRFIELPYTLAQDYTLASVLGEETPRLWLEKVDFIRENHGLALLNTHPDYLRSAATWRIYSEFLNVMSERRDHYHALPRDVAGWWRARAQAKTLDELPGGAAGAVGRPTETAWNRSVESQDRHEQSAEFKVRPMDLRDIREVRSAQARRDRLRRLAGRGRRGLCDGERPPAHVLAFPSQVARRGSTPGRGRGSGWKSAELGASRGHGAEAVSTRSEAPVASRDDDVHRGGALDRERGDRPPPRRHVHHRGAAPRRVPNHADHSKVRQRAGQPLLSPARFQDRGRAPPPGP